MKEQSPVGRIWELGEKEHAKLITADILVSKGRNTFALQADSCIRLCSRFHLIGNLTVNGINTHLTAKCSLCKCDRSC